MVGGPGRTRLASIRGVSDEPTYLHELIGTIGSGPDLETILRGVVRLVTEATACHACFVYFLRVDGILELRAASRMYESLEGEVTIPLGEGLTGWVASTRRSAFIKEHALEDPRVRRATFPELGDELYQSLVSVPVFSRAGEVLGVITLHAEAPHEFEPADLDFLEHTASLIGGAVENARLYEDATARVGLLSSLSRLSQRIASAASVDEVLGAVIEGLREVLGAERCEIYLADADERLRLAAALPSRSDPGPLDAATLMAARTLDRAEGSDDADRWAASLWGDDAAGTAWFEPLVAGDQRLGVLALLSPSAPPDAAKAVAAVAAHTAVAVRQHQVIEGLREKNLVRDLFLALTRPDVPLEEIAGLAGRLRCNLDAAHLVLHVIPWSGNGRRRGRRSDRHDAEEWAEGAPGASWAELTDHVEAKLSSRFSRILVDRLERSARVLVPTGDSPEEVLRIVRAMDWSEAGGAMRWAVGVSNPCSGAQSFARGLEEAAGAAEVGSLMQGAPSVTTYDDLGPYRYVLRAGEDFRDQIQDSLQQLVDYDRKRDTELLDTLDGYLDHRGNVVATSRALYIHPNTLRQRIARIEHVSRLDLEGQDWLSLAMAVKIVKLRRMRTTRREESAEHG